MSKIPASGQAAAPDGTPTPRPARNGLRAVRDGEAPFRIRVGTICDLVRTVPEQLGFVPERSLVVVCVADGTVGRLMRADLPDAREQWAWDLEVTDLAAALARHAGSGDRCVLVLYSDAAPAAAHLGGIAEVFRRAGCDVLATALVDDDLIQDVSAEGLVVGSAPLEVPGNEAVARFRAANALLGRVVLPDRESVRRSIEPPSGDDASAGLEAIASVLATLRTAPSDTGDAVPTAVIEQTLHAALAQTGDRGGVELTTAARLSAICWSAGDRDRLLVTMLRRHRDPCVPMLVSALRAVPAQESVDLCSLLVVMAYRSGDGALAQLAADRALAALPSHPLTWLMLDVMAAGLPPSSLDGMCSPP